MRQGMKDKFWLYANWVWLQLGRTCGKEMCVHSDYFCYLHEFGDH